MAESEKERRDREKREKRERDQKDWDAIKKRQDQKAWERREKAIEAAAEKEARERLEDDYLAKEFLDLVGTDIRAAEDYLDIARGADPSDEEVQQAIQAIKDAQKAKQGGVFTSGNPGKAKGIIKKHQKAIRNTIKKGKKAKKGCLTVFAGLTATGAATLYGMYEAGYAIASAIF